MDLQPLMGPPYGTPLEVSILDMEDLIRTVNL